MNQKKRPKTTRTRSVFKKRAEFFLEHARQNKSVTKYKTGKQFLEKFKFSLYKTKNRTFLIDLKKNLTSTPLSIAIIFNNPKLKNKNVIAYEARIRFSGKNIIIESLQGSKNLIEIRDFENLVGLPASRYLFKEIYNQAKKAGYKKVLIRKPENQISYKDPNWVDSLDKRGKKLLEKIQFNEATSLEIKEFEKHREEAIKIIRARMKKIYETVAIAEGMRVQENYFVKEVK